MRDPRWTLVAILSCLTAVSLGLTGEITRAALLLPLAAVVGEWRARRHREAGLLLPGLFQTLAVLALAFFAWRLARFDLLGGAVALTLPVQAYYLVLPRDHRLLTRLQVLSFFQLIALAATTTKITFVLSLAAYLILAPAALTLAALEGGQVLRRPVPLPRGLLKAGVGAAALGLLGGLVLFLILPRYEAGIGQQLSREDQRLTGFSDEVRLGDIGRILTSDAIVMRVGVEGRVGGMVRWRGLALDEFSGRGWRLGEVPTRRVLAGRSEGLLEVATAPPEEEAVRQEVLLEPMQSRALFALPGAFQLRSEDFHGIEVDAYGGLERLGSARSRQRYTVWSWPGRPPAASEDAALLERCLQLPPLDPRVVTLAREIVEGLQQPAERAARLESYLQESHAYTLDVRDAGLRDPVSTFLLERRAGHCEYFASGMVVLARVLGIPARMVTGFQAGTRSRFTRRFVVRERDAHSWVEAYLPGSGWTTFDPTPTVERIGEGRALPGFGEAWRMVLTFWDDHVVGFNVTHQLAAVTTLGEWREAAAQLLRRPESGRALGGLTGLAVLIAALLAWRQAARRVRPSHAFYVRVLRLLESRGLRLREGQTPGELSRQAALRGGPAGSAAVELTQMYYAARFGGTEPDPERVAALLERLEGLPNLRPSCPCLSLHPARTSAGSSWVAGGAGGADVS